MAIESAKTMLGTGKSPSDDLSCECMVAFWFKSIIRVLPGLSEE
jgi:hypothetical protein